MIGLCAVYQALLGAYFIAFRPALLPEDLRFLGTSVAQVSRDQPALERWLDLVFKVVGGQMMALGFLLGAFALHLLRRGAIHRLELLLIGIAGLLSVTLMSAVNFALGSNFRWLLVLPVLAWAAGLAFAAMAADIRSTESTEGGRAD
jgi:hypothetical protein